MLVKYLGKTCLGQGWLVQRPWGRNEPGTYEITAGVERERVQTQEVRFGAQQRPASTGRRIEGARPLARAGNGSQACPGEACPQTLCQAGPQEGRAGSKATPSPLPFLEALGDSACPGRSSRCLRGSSVFPHQKGHPTRLPRLTAWELCYRRFSQAAHRLQEGVCHLGTVPYCTEVLHHQAPSPPSSQKPS